MKEMKFLSLRKIKAIAACMLIPSMIFSSACKKKVKRQLIESIQYKSGQEILETDPFFNSEVNLISLPPIEEGREVESTNLNMMGFYGENAIAEYNITFKSMEDFDMSEISSYEELVEKSKEYYRNGYAIYDEKGNYLKDVPEDITLIYDITSDPDGHTCILGYGAKSEKTPWEKVLICAVLNRDGSVSERIIFTGAPFEAANMGAPYLRVLSDGRYSIRQFGTLYVFDKKGKLEYTVSEPDRTIGTGIITKNGKNYVLSFGYDPQSDVESILIKEINIKTGELGNSYDASGLSAYGELRPTSQGLFVNSDTGCYEYDIETGKITKFFDWSDTDIDRSLINYMPCKPVPKTTDEICAVGLKRTVDPFEYYLIHLTRAEKNPHAGKKMIVIGGIDINNDTSLMSFISEYNSDPEKSCRAMLVDYTEDLESGTSRADIENKVLLALLSGEGPDILVNFSESYAFQNVNVMEDLNPYLDGEDGISRQEYFDNVLRAQEWNGKLFHIPIRFALEGLLANRKYIGNTIGWTFDEFEEAAAGMPENVGIMEGLLYRDFLKMLLTPTMSSFVDYQNKTVDFQNADMKKYLQMAKKFGVAKLAEDEGTMKWYDGDKLQDDYDLSRIKFDNGLIALRREQMMSLSDFGVCTPGQHYTFLGYPSMDGAGPAIKPYLSMGIVASGKYKDLAWDFLRSFLAFTGDLDYSEIAFSINRQVFEKECAATVAYRNDLYDELHSEEEKDNWSEEYLNSLVRYTEQDVDDLRKMIESSNTTLCYDAAMLDIITEEAAAYFAGDRTEEDVLKNIQNRCTLIVKERG